MPMNRRRFLLSLCVVIQLLPVDLSWANEPADPPLKWYKGNTHAHSLWSDGRDFPEFVVKHYRDRGYHFFCLSEHNIIADHGFWRDVETANKRAYDADALARYQKEFGAEWVELREYDGKKQVRLKKLSEIAPLFEKPGEFILMRAEEITDRCEDLPVHLNAINLRELLAPQHGDKVAEALHNNLAAVREQERAAMRPVLVHINHPNFNFALTAEDLADQPLGLFLEFHNAGTDEIPGDDLHCSDERNWDIANTIRIAEKKLHPYYGVGSDDVHAWFGKPHDEAERAWIMVRAPELTPAALIEAMRQGDFYVSTGVTLANVVYSPEKKLLVVEIVPEDGAEYTIEFIGTFADCDLKSEPVTDAEGKAVRATRRYSDEVGQIFKSVKGKRAEYELTGRELYIRARVTSSKPAVYPTYKGQLQQAWTQPVGWETRVKRMVIIE